MVSRRIKELRSEWNLTQKELASRIGSTAKNIWAYENDIAVPPLDVLIRLADLFGCSIDFLAGRSDDFGVPSVSPPATNFLTKEENALLKQFRALTPSLRALAVDTLTLWAKEK